MLSSDTDTGAKGEAAALASRGRSENHPSFYLGDAVGKRS
jgi:hypothetical protein